MKVAEGQVGKQSFLFEWKSSDKQLANEEMLCQKETSNEQDGSGTPSEEVLQGREDANVPNEDLH